MRLVRKRETVDPRMWFDPENLRHDLVRDARRELLPIAAGMAFEDPLVDALARPPRLDAEGVVTLERELAARVELGRIPETPAVGTPGALVAMPSDGPSMAVR